MEVHWYSQNKLSAGLMHWNSEITYTKGRMPSEQCAITGACAKHKTLLWLQVFCLVKVGTVLFYTSRAWLMVVLKVNLWLDLAAAVASVAGLVLIPVGWASLALSVWHFLGNMWDLSWFWDLWFWYLSNLAGITVRSERLSEGDFDAFFCILNIIVIKKCRLSEVYWNKIKLVSEDKICCITNFQMFTTSLSVFSFQW